MDDNRKKYLPLKLTVDAQYCITNSSSKDDKKDVPVKKLAPLKYHELFPDEPTSNKKSNEAPVSARKITPLRHSELYADQPRSNTKDSVPAKKYAPLRHNELYDQPKSNTKVQEKKRKAVCDSASSKCKRAKQQGSGGHTINRIRRSSVYLQGSLKKAKKQLFTNKTSNRPENTSLDVCDINNLSPGISRLNDEDLHGGTDFDIENEYECENINNTSNISTASGEFLKLEAKCGIISKSSQIAVSPLSSITNKLKTTTISQKKQSSKSNQSDEVATIMEKLDRSIKVYHANYTNGINKINNQLRNLTENHANIMSEFEDAMKSLNRIKEGSEFTGVKPSTPRPKTPLRKNLRVATLNKNLSKQGFTTEMPIVDEAMEKAIDYYNSMRKDFTCLSTPKGDRSMLDAHKSLSINIQKQCLMLLDNTPKVKK